MPAGLHEDAVAWLRSRGSPITTRNLNTAVAYLNENPEARPSYSSQVSEETGMSSMPEGILRAFNDGEMPQLDSEADPQDISGGRSAASVTGQDGSIPAERLRALQRVTDRDPLTTRITGSPSSRFMRDRQRALADGETRDLEGQRGIAGMKLEEKDYEQSGIRPPYARRRLGDRPNDPRYKTEEQDQTNPGRRLGEYPHPEERAMDVEDVAAVGAGAATAGLGVELANKLKNTLQEAKNDAWVRDNFAKNIKSRVENAEARAGGRGSRDMYQVDALNEAMKQVRAGDMAGAQKSLELLDLDDQKALKSILANPPAATKRGPTMLQRALMGITRR